ncbi:type II toxin-antitoxin system HicA family toxin [Gloeocapsopsis dulcis]|uniref:Addiction module toxin, HicA family n=1 Tax=Gloeocapsopsis dulcis AAB1 = 1H9 TaxID=1433147 RepID=A0A6N8FW03_9CHRO|nr:type II toxin-antitoxin system HicA family toxin [Gloeocapsopsis dulcis]MUL37308.1 hypothetical protein [Gloeocapsopsis dulcis AAB1 = 1H9]WNN91115.1 type II toxin-antitoxin system HicA family toxin [Gloeocapsopsis dulcis]
MPRLPRISAKEAIRVLERLEFEQVRQTGSHVVMKKKSNKPVSTSHLAQMLLCLIQLNLS